MTRHVCAVVCALAVAGLLPGCGDPPELPMAPSTLAEGVTVYEHANFHGNSAHITTDISNLEDFRGPCVHDDGEGGVTRDWNDCISSIQVAPGWEATVYRAPNYRDDSLAVTADVPNLQLVPGDCPHDGLNDCISSLRVRRR